MLDNLIEKLEEKVMDFLVKVEKTVRDEPAFGISGILIFLASIMFLNLVLSPEPQIEQKISITGEVESLSGISVSPVPNKNVSIGTGCDEIIASDVTGQNGSFELRIDGNYSKSEFRFCTDSVSTDRFNLSTINQPHSVEMNLGIHSTVTFFNVSYM